MMPFGFALVGLDHWYNGFPMLKAINASPLSKLLWISDDNPEHLGEMVKEHHPKHHTTDYREVLDDPDVQVITSFTSSDKNAELCIAAAEAGKHLISIKPMAMNLEEADLVVNAVKQAGVKYFPGAASHVFYQTYQTFEKWIKQGRIGDLVVTNSLFHASLPQDWPTSDSPGWFADPERVPGGAWIDHAIFYIQVFRTIFGSEVVTIEGVTTNLKYPELPLEDYGKSIFTFDNGGIATITSTWLGAAGANRVGLEFYGTEGTLVWDSLINKIGITGDFSPELPGWILLDQPPDKVSRAVKIIAHLVTCIEQDKETICTVEDDRTNLKIALAFYEAAKRKSAVQL
jgi:predicted dehydrogenase